MLSRNFKRRLTRHAIANLMGNRDAALESSIPVVVGLHTGVSNPWRGHLHFDEDKLAFVQQGECYFWNCSSLLIGWCQQFCGAGKKKIAGLFQTYLVKCVWPCLLWNISKPAAFISFPPWKIVRVWSLQIMVLAWKWSIKIRPSRFNKDRRVEADGTLQCT